VQVERFAAPSESDMEMFLDDQGMLAVPSFAGHGDGGLTAIRTLASRGSFSLLGEPGAGKTTALESIIGGIPELDAAEPCQDAVLLVPLGEIADRAAFHDLVTGPVLARVPAGQGEPGGRLTLVLDGLDECPLPGGARVFAGLLREMLKDADTAALRVLIGCRSAEYPAPVHELLAKALGSFRSYELAPLSRADITALAASRDADPAAFLAEVARTGTGPLACLPLSLHVLLLQYRSTGGLQGPPAQLYKTALLMLADEPDRDRDATRRTWSREQILAVGARLCCHLLLCGRGAFWTGPPDLMPPGHLEPSGLAGGEEHQTGGPFEVTAGLISAALNSALFTTRGPNRRAPAHATFAAYLAARHLASRHLPDPQLRSLLTTSTSTSTSSGVIAALRETAAWLLALRPDSTSWLADSEFASLAVYAAVIDDPGIRRVFTEHLLADPRVLLRSPRRHSWDLAHPGLAGQLASVLQALADPGALQPGRDQSYLALTLAREAGIAGLMPSLLQIAARVDLDSWLRTQAVRAAAHIDAASAAPVLTRVLAEITAHPDRDPDDETRGITLIYLWPRHLAVQDLVTNLTRPRRDNLLGAYYIFRRDLPGQLSDDDVPHLLTWALTAAARHGVADDDDLIPALLDRAFTCRDLTAVISPAADLVAAQLQAYRTPTIPASLDERGDDGAETETSRERRRLLAAELLSRHADTVGQLAVWGWEPAAAAVGRHADAVRSGKVGFPAARRSLVDAADLHWLLQQAETAGPSLAGVYVPLLRAVFDPMDDAAREAAWQTQGTGLWPAFSAWFDDVELGGEAEALQRRIFEASQPRPAGWEHAATHAVRVLDLYDAARSDTSAFEELLWNLQIDPVTGHGEHTRQADIANRPGIRLLPPGWDGQLREAAWNYLNQRTPPGPDLLDRPGRLPWPAEVGYLALAHLVLHEAPSRTLAALDGRVPARWAAPILAYPEYHDAKDDGHAKPVLLARLAQVAPDDLPALISKLAAGHLASGSWPAGLEALDAVCTGPVGDVLAGHLRVVIDAMAAALASHAVQPDQHRLDQRLAALQYTTTTLVRILTRCGHAAGIKAARGIIADGVVPGVGEALVLAARAAAVGLVTGATRHWHEVTGQLSGTPSLLQAVLRDLAGDRTSRFAADLTDSELAGLWNLLKQFWPYQDDGDLWTSGVVGADQQARHWRDGVLETLVLRGTSEAAGLLQQLAEFNPDLPWLADQARRAQDLHRQRDWAPLSSGDLTRLLRDSKSRLVRDIAELTAVVLEALDTLQEQALWPHGWSMLMWNRAEEATRDEWWPTWEDNLSNLICAFLREHLAERKPVINREVEIRPKNIDGARTDIHIQATDPRDSASEPLTVIIEVKGCWNPEIRTGISRQLVPYLQPHPGWAGIFLVGYFHHPGREHSSYTGTPGRGGSRGRHRTSQKHAPEKILGDLQQQIAAARPGNITHARVLRLPLIPPPASSQA
jgi:hypothetical protein